MISLFTLLYTAAAHPNHTQSWENWDNIEICQTDHEKCHAVFEATPRATRNPNIVRFADPNLREAQWTALHIARLQNTEESLETRLALLELISRSEGEWEKDVLFLIEDSAPEMRVLLVQTTKQGSAEYADAVFSALVEDVEPSVRATVYRTLQSNNIEKYEQLFLLGLQDENEKVQVAAIRGIGWNRIPADIELFTPFLAHSNPELRLYALRTISRLDPEKAASLPQLKSLQQDSNPKVAREASRLSR